MTHKNHSVKAYIGLGSNVGDAQDNVRRAVRELSKISKVCARSSLYLTKPWGYLEQVDFINAVTQIETDLEPQQLMNELKEIEKRMGRTATPLRWGPRLIDLDILTFGNDQITHSGLTIPHPHMLERALCFSAASRA